MCVRENKGNYKFKPLNTVIMPTEQWKSNSKSYAEFIACGVSKRRLKRLSNATYLCVEILLDKQIPRSPPVTSYLNVQQPEL